MNEDRHIIWSNFDLNYEDWKDDLEASGKAILDVCTKMTGSDAVFLRTVPGFFSCPLL